MKFEDEAQECQVEVQLLVTAPDRVVRRGSLQQVDRNQAVAVIETVTPSELGVGSWVHLDFRGDGERTTAFAEVIAASPSRTGVL